MRWLGLTLVLATVLAALTLFQGMIAAGLVPLAVFGPIYALARTAGEGAASARAHAARVTVAASACLGLAFVPALAPTGGPLPRWATIGVAVTATGAGALAGFAGADHQTRSEARGKRWSFLQALDPRHARGLALLAGVAVLGGTLIALLREAPIARLGDAARTLPVAVLGDHAVDGALVLPDPASSIAIAIPLSLAPLALGFLTSPERSAPFAVGAAATLALAPLVVHLDVPVRATTGAWVPITVLGSPGLAVLEALAPSAVGLLVAAGLVTLLGRWTPNPRAGSVAWALLAAPIAALAWGLIPGIAVLLGLAAAAAIVALATNRAAFGFAILLGALAGGLAQALLTPPAAWTMGALVGAAAGAAAGTQAATRAIEAPAGSLRSPWTLAYLLVSLLAVGTVFAIGPDLATELGPFPAPHASGLAAALAGLLEAQGLALLAWGLAAGAVIQLTVGRGAWIGLGALAGPGIALLVLSGSLLRALWEEGLLERAREGYVMRGQLGYELVRAHVLVAGVLAGEALAMAIAGAIG